MKPKIKLTPQNVGSGCILLALIALNIWGRSIIPADASGGTRPSEPPPEPTPDPETAPDPDPIVATPQLMATQEIGATLQVRATYLLRLGQDNGNAKQWLQTHQNNVLWELNDLRKQLGSFDGNPDAFARKTNLESELAAIELALWWIATPASREELPSIPTNQPLTYFVEGDIVPTGGLIEYEAHGE